MPMFLGGWCGTRRGSSFSAFLLTTRSKAISYTLDNGNSATVNSFYFDNFTPFTLSFMIDFCA